MKKLIEYTREDLQPYFNVTIRQAAIELKLSETYLKAICRFLDIPRWPYRRLTCLQKRFDLLEAKFLRSGNEPIKKQLLKITNEIEEIQNDPSLVSQKLERVTKRKNKKKKISIDDSNTSTKKIETDSCVSVDKIKKKSNKTKVVNITDSSLGATYQAQINVSLSNQNFGEINVFNNENRAKFIWDNLPLQFANNDVNSINMRGNSGLFLKLNLNSFNYDELDPFI